MSDNATQTTTQLGGTQTSQTHDNIQHTATTTHSVAANTTAPNTISDLIPKNQVDALIEKVRSDEKAKVYGKIEELNRSKVESEKQLKELQDAMSKIQEEKNAKVGTVEDELRALKDQNEKLKKAIDEVASSAAEKIRMSELKAYREQKIRESGLRLTELVSGNTEEQIDTAIDIARKRELEIEEKIRADLQKKIADQLPTPISIDGSQGRGPSPSLSAKNRDQMARLPNEQYAKQRDELLLEAKRRAGIIS